MRTLSVLPPTHYSKRFATIGLLMTALYYAGMANGAAGLTPALQSTEKIVTDQGPQTAEQFYQALEKGGTVRIVSNGGLILSRTVVITNDTVLDATGYEFTLDGDRKVRLFHVLKDASLTLSNLVLVRGFSKGERGGRGDVAREGSGGEANACQPEHILASGMRNVKSKSRHGKFRADQAPPPPRLRTAAMRKARAAHPASSVTFSCAAFRSA